MKCFTLDSNCIIDLEENRDNAVYLRQLIEQWKLGNVDIAVVSVSASENQPGGKANQEYAVFEAKLEKSGLKGARELEPIGIWDMGYWDHMLWSSEELDKQAEEIRDILFPDVQHEPPDNTGENSKWRNQMCDVLVAWSHGFHKSDILVTSDMNFHKKAESLRRYGVHKVMTPEQASVFACGI